MEQKRRLQPSPHLGELQKQRHLNSVSRLPSSSGRATV